MSFQPTDIPLPPPLGIERTESPLVAGFERGPILDRLPPGQVGRVPPDIPLGGTDRSAFSLIEGGLTPGHPDFVSPHHQTTVASEAAGWEVTYGLSGDGGGLVIHGASFLGIPIVAHASQPFSLLTYQAGVALKDGIGVELPDAFGPGVGGPYVALHHGAPEDLTVWPEVEAAGVVLDPADPLALDKAVEVSFHDERPAGSPIYPASLALSARFQAGLGRQYVQRWEFNADGSIEPSVALTGNPSLGAAGGYVVNFYYRLQFALGAGTQVASVLTGTMTGNKGGIDVPTWSQLHAGAAAITAQGATHTRLRISRGGLGADPSAVNDEPIIEDEPREGDLLAGFEPSLDPQDETHHRPTVPSYDIVPGAYLPPDQFYSSADFFVMDAGPDVVFGPGPFGSTDTLGAGVGASDARDAALMQTYAFFLGPLSHGGELSLGGDLLVWHAMRQYGAPRYGAEDSGRRRPEFVHCSLVPRGVLTETPPESWEGSDSSEFVAPELA